MSPTGQTAVSMPPKRSVTQPSRTHAPSTTGSRRLNQRRRAPTREASAAAPGSSAFRTAQSSGPWLRKIRALASVYAARLPCRSRWSGVTFSTAATRGRKASVVSSWKLETSATTQPSAGNRSASAASGRPMFPPTKTGRSDSAKSAPVSAVVVVFPFVPVIATNSAVIVRYASSISAITGIPRARQAASDGWAAGTPGLTTTSSAVRKASSGCPPTMRRTPSARSARASGGRTSSARASVPVTRARRAWRSRQAATPLRASPTTVTARPARASRQGRPRGASRSVEPGCSSVIVVIGA